MPEKNHKNTIDYYRLQLEENHNCKCKREFDLIRNFNFHKLDLTCVCKDKPPIAIEIESSKNFENPQIKSNAEDLNEFKRIYPNAKTFHIHISEEIDFNKELKNNPLQSFKNNKPQTVTKQHNPQLPKSKLAFGW